MQFQQFGFPTREENVPSVSVGHQCCLHSLMAKSGWLTVPVESEDKQSGKTSYKQMSHVQYKLNYTTA